MICPQLSERDKSKPNVWRLVVQFVICFQKCAPLPHCPWSKKRLLSLHWSLKWLPLSPHTLIFLQAWPPPRHSTSAGYCSPPRLALLGTNSRHPAAQSSRSTNNQDQDGTCDYISSSWGAHRHEKHLVDSLPASGVPVSMSRHPSKAKCTIWLKSKAGLKVTLKLSGRNAFSTIWLHLFSGRNCRYFSSHKRQRPAY